ncbi:MAG TPA: metallophosphoesterase [Thermoanaerobaculia bacterium]|nr:metallophosphoesterase [Thermoanaerobaculia bacterium]
MTPARPPQGGDGDRRRDRLTAHRGLATWGERLVPLDDFRRAVAAAGGELPAAERARAAARFLARPADPTPVEGPFARVALFGGVYNNHLALTALLEEAAGERVEALYCLGDLGGFGPSPEKVPPLLAAGGVACVAGNYEQSLARGAEDCNCGYTDPRDNHFARLSYRYTAERTPAAVRRWMGTLSPRRRVRVGERELLLVHGSPRQVNEFLFASTTPTAWLELLLDQEGADALACTHTGLHWHRRLPSGREVINVGVIGRPANDGDPRVWWTLVSARGDQLEVALRPLAYDHRGLAAEMRREGLPEEFVATILDGWWTTCLEVLPSKERAQGRY